MNVKKDSEQTHEKKITTRDVAAACGISQPTVSMILSRRPGVSFRPETVRLVEETAHKLGYIYNGKRVKKEDRLRRTILIMCPSISTDYYITLIRSISEYSEEKNLFTLISYTLRSPVREAQYLNMAADSGFRGVIYTFSPRAIDTLRQLRDVLPFVVIGDRTPDLSLPMVELDSRKSATLITNHLLDLGHKKIAYVTGPLDSSETPRIRRLEGIQETVAARGLPEDTVTLLTLPKEIWQLTAAGNRHYRTGYDMTMRYFRQPDADATALVGENDMIAFGIIDALKKLGYRIPEDISVCGFDNSQESGYSGISLTSVDHCIAEKGQTAVDLLLSQNQNGPAKRALTRIEYQPQLIIRNSTGKCPEK